VVPTEIGFEDWVIAVFDTTVEDPSPPPALALSHLTRLFNDPVPALELFTDDEIGVGLWSVLDSGGAGTVMVLNDRSLPVLDRIACVDAMRRLYGKLLAPRCSPRLGHTNDPGSGLEMVLYMFWDVASFAGPPDDWDGDLLEDAVLGLLEAVLYVNHAGLQESAIHGLGHRVGRHPQRAANILVRWKRRGLVCDPRLRSYADAAQVGCIQ
jgi:hypothetical protein